MKKLFALALAFTMVLSMSACGQKTAAPAAEENKDSTPAPAAEKLTVQIAYENNPGEPIDEACKEWQRIVKERSNGSIEIQLFPSSQLGSKTDLMDQMTMGEAIVTICDASWLAEYGAPEIGIASFPYIYDNWDQCWKLVESDWWDEQEALLEKSNIHIITANWIYGERHIITTKPVYSIEDMQGLILRTPNTASYMKAFELMGAAPTAMAAGECYTAIQQGSIDGMENVFSYLYGSALYEVAKYMTLTGHVKMPCQWICSQTWWDTLTDEQKSILSETGEEAGLFNNDLQIKSQDEYSAKMVEQGVTIIELSDDERAKFAEAASGLYADPAVTAGWRDGLYDQIKAIIE